MKFYNILANKIRRSKKTRTRGIRSTINTIKKLFNEICNAYINIWFN